MCRAKWTKTKIKIQKNLQSNKKNKQKTKPRKTLKTSFAKMKQKNIRIVLRIVRILLLEKHKQDHNIKTNTNVIGLFISFNLNELKTLIYFVYLDVYNQNKKTPGPRLPTENSCVCVFVSVDIFRLLLI